MKKNITTVSFFSFKGFFNQWWAFSRMGLSPFRMKKESGLQFFKFLGSGGGNGFSIRPNFGTYGILCVWDDETAAQHFFEKSNLFKDYAAHSHEQWTVFMETMMAHGEWDGATPFTVTRDFDDRVPVAVITRATIKLKFLPYFWKFVPPVSASIIEKKGRLFSVGIGEVPIVQQATFSLWESTKLMMDYAYKSPFHAEVVRKTRELGWYKEELFARFSPYKTMGTWGNEDVLKPFLAKAENRE
jgi:hypothetical protein